MDKLYSFFENLYSSDSKFMLYIYVGIAVITILLILIIIFSSIGNLISRNKQKKLEKKETDALANKNSQVIPVIPESQNQKELVAEKIVNKDNNTEVKSDLLNSKDLKLELESDQINIKEIQPIPDELLSKEIASIPEKESLDLTRPIPRVNTASDLLNEFVFDNKEESITSEDLNKPLTLETSNKPVEEVFSSVFLDKKEEQVLESPKKPKIDLILTPIDELSKTFQQELILSPEILKPVTSIKTDTPPKNKSEPKKVVKKEEHKNSILKEKNKRSNLKNIKEEEKTNLKNIKEEEKTNLKNIKEKTSNEESLDTKIDIFSHESLVKKTLDFDPFKPKSQEELLGTETKESTNINTPVVLTTTDLKNRLNQLKTKINKTKPNEEINNILKEVGLDVLPNISEQQKEASTALKR